MDYPEIFNLGLVSIGEKNAFSPFGCEYCRQGAGETYEIKYRESLDGEIYQGELCGECINNLYYGE